MGFLLVSQVQKYCDSSEDVKCSGHPSTYKTGENVEQVKELVLKKPKNT
jgi:hypothetical protein